MIYVIGAGGHAKVILELLEDNKEKIGGFIDTFSNQSALYGYPIFTHFPPEVLPEFFKAVIAVGDNNLRRKIYDSYAGLNFAVVRHVKCNISSRSVINEGSVVMAGVSINCDVHIGKHCIINTNASIDHDCNISDFVHIAPNCALAGNVCVGEGTHIGIGASVIQGIRIGKWTTIGAGAVVIQDVPDFAVVVGVPGRIIKYKKKNEG